MTHPASRRQETARVERWPSEGPLLLLVILISIGVWLLLVITIVGVLYALLIGLFFFLAHVGFVAHVRGNGVKVGPDQFPGLDEAVQRLSLKLGLRQVPEAYVMQAGGALNALATKFLRSNMIVLFSDLIEACGEDTAARDMIIAHELGHIRAGHLQMRGFLLPGHFVPFLGQALSRAREYTSDRYGLLGAGDRDGALLGLTILAAGPRCGRQVNRAALARQRTDINTGWMTIGEWLSTHPPLAKRVAALDPALRPDLRSPHAGAMRALAIIGLAIACVVGPSAFFIAKVIPTLGQLSAQAQESTVVAPADTAAAMAQAEADLAQLAWLIEDSRLAGSEIPVNSEALYELWSASAPEDPEPLDPFDGLRYGYVAFEGEYYLYSSGPDGVPGSDDDIFFDSSEE